MAVGLTDIKRRMAATGKVAKTTAALQKVAAVKLMRSRRIQAGIDVYADRLASVIQTLAGLPGNHDHPFLNPGRGEHILVAIFGSDRSLCGPFNTILTEKLEEFVTAVAPASVQLIPVGRIVHKRVRRLGLPTRESPDQPAMETFMPSATGETAPGNPFSRLLETITSDFLAGRVREAYVLYSRFISTLDQQPTVERLLPIPLVPRRGNELRWGSAAGFEPGLHEIASRLLPEYADMFLRHAAVNSLASENAFRQSAMSRASDSAREIMEGLTMQYRRLRQESITTELLEIASSMQTP